MLKRVHIKNFLSIRTQTVIQLDSVQTTDNEYRHIVIVGENGSGKTNIVRAIEHLFTNERCKEKDYHVFLELTHLDDLHKYIENLIDLNKSEKNLSDIQEINTIRKAKTNLRDGIQVLYFGKKFPSEDSSTQLFYVAKLRDFTLSCNTSDTIQVHKNVQTSNIFDILSQKTNLEFKLVDIKNELINFLKVVSDYVRSQVEILGEQRLSNEELTNRLFKLKIGNQFKKFADFQKKYLELCPRYSTVEALSQDEPLELYKEYLNKDFQVKPMLHFETNNGISLNLNTISGGDRDLLSVVYVLRGSNAKTVILDEPERCLHPSKQAILRDAIFENEKRAVLLITHSAIMMNHKNIRHISKCISTESGTKIFQIHTALNCIKDNEKRTKMITFILRPTVAPSIFFSSRILFVEGPSDNRFLQHLYDLGVYKQHKELNNIKFNWTVCYTESKNTITKELLDLCNSLEINWRVIIDRDSFIHREKKKYIITGKGQ